jgi:hypothetical protein
MDKYYILTFENTHGAIYAEGALKEKKIKMQIMPTPTFITKSCGISIRISDEFIDKVKTLISEEVIKVKAIYVKCEGEYKFIENNINL